MCWLWSVCVCAFGKPTVTVHRTPLIDWEGGREREREREREKEIDVAVNLHAGDDVPSLHVCFKRR